MIAEPPEDGERRLGEVFREALEDQQRTALAKMVADLFAVERPRRKRGRPGTPPDQNLDEWRYRIAVWAREAGHASANASDLDAFLAARAYFLSPKGQAEIAGSELPDAKQRWLLRTVFKRNVTDKSLKRSIERGKASIVGV